MHYYDPTEYPKFSGANTKIHKLAKIESLWPYLRGGRKIYSFDLLSGHSCPFASKCLSKVVETVDGRRIQDGEDIEFRCFSASQEALYPSVYDHRKRNFDIVRRYHTGREIAGIINHAMPTDAGIVRVHVAGDFFSDRYFRAWLSIAEIHPDKLFYFYTKAIPYLIRYRESLESLSNIVYTASYGGKYDDLIESNGLRYVRVIRSTLERDHYGLQLDSDDSHAADPKMRSQSFGLYIHGAQPAGFKAKNKELQFS